MENIIVDRITVLFDTDGKQSADLFADACAKSVPLIHAAWGLNVPPKCKVYVMTSWQKFLYHSASWPIKIVYALLFPLLYVRINRQWPKIAGWTFRHQPTVGVKPPALLDLADKTIGEKIYIPDTNLDRKVQASLCHELVHAFSNHLKLPLWLNEGIAMVTVDKFIGTQTVKDETINVLDAYPYKHRLLNYRNLMNMDLDSIVYNYVRGYWLTRYLEQVHPGCVQGLLGKRQKESEIVKQLSVKTGIPSKEFWNEIDRKIFEQFASLSPSAGPP